MDCALTAGATDRSPLPLLRDPANALKRHSSFLVKSIGAPLLLLIVAALTYGLLLPRMGFYWDDLLSIWIRYQLGPEAMMRPFSVSRPALGAFFRLSTAVLPPDPIYWQCFALLWRWAASAALWGLMRSLWPGRDFFALTVGLLFLIYPGFNQQYVAYIYSHYFAIFTFFLLSLLAMIWSLLYPRWRWPLTGLSLLLSAANLWLLEYFFLLELLRPMLIWIALSRDAPGTRPRLGQTAWVWAPYLTLFVAAILWQIFIFRHQLYDFTLPSRLATAPLATLASLGGAMLNSIWLAGGAAWAQVFQFPHPAVDAARATLVYAAVVLMTGTLVTVYFLCMPRAEKPEAPRQPIALGLIALLLAGWPFYSIGLSVSLGFPGNRFTLPFIPGVSLILGALLDWLPRRRLKTWLLAGLIALAAGRHFLWAGDYVREWELQKSLFWQMSWRVPALAPDTLILMNDEALDYYADNSLSAALNWIYAPRPASERMPYVLFHPRSRLGGSLPGLEPGHAVRYNYLVATFAGNTSQAVVMDFDPPGCLRVLDAELDAVNPMIPDTLRAAAPLSKNEWILTDGAPRLPWLYYPQPPHDWCYYFEKADLARQQGDWQMVAALGEEAFASGYQPYNPMERLVFIEAYGRLGDWERAGVESVQAQRLWPTLRAPLCLLWDRIAADTPDSPEKQTALAKVRAKVNCEP